ncbi:MAG TPA: thioesterase [Lachnospiraceae bacterium]|nr:thioesterase domain-containing protein [uncultured Lachnoclostridium sp.]HAU85260.1 thioesterase [Lachnospiraceae bacterium]
MAKTKLFFLPYAGGSAMSYMIMKRLFDETTFEPVPLELAGRGTRAKESAYTDVNLCVQDLYEKMKPQTIHCDYAIFGHSLGTIVGYELLKYIEEKEDKLPKCVISSGRAAPGIEFPGPIIGGLKDEAFMKKIGMFQALPSEVLNNRKILELVLPVLRADVKMSEQYQYKIRKPAKCDFYIFYGKDDCLVTEEGINCWEDETERKIEITCFPGGHFYFKEYKELFTEKVNKIMTQYVQ